MSPMPARIVHVGVNRGAAEVYAFAADPQNMPKWASGLAGGLQPDGDDWIADGGPLGEVRVSFAAPNELGVIDHTVTMPNGDQVMNALRVTPNGDGCEVAFTVLRQPGTDDAAFDADAAHVLKDLKTLKQLMGAA
ncbi:SRPBCC family protein [soil metagenome]